MKKYEAIRKVLEDASRPLHYTVIAEAIKNQGLYDTTSKNWYKAVNSDLSKIIRVMKESGEEPWLYRHSSGVYGLSEVKLMKKHEAIRKVLEDAGRPLHYTVIADAIRNQGLYYSESKNWYKAVNTDCWKITRVKGKNGEESWLYRHGPGIYGLSEWKKS